MDENKNILPLIQFSIETNIKVATRNCCPMFSILPSHTLTNDAKVKLFENIHIYVQYVPLNALEPELTVNLVSFSLKG